MKRRVKDMLKNTLKLKRLDIMLILEAKEERKIKENQ